MAHRYRAELMTPDVLAAQLRAYGKQQAIPPTRERDAIGDDERAMIETRDSFYLATVGADGWPYVQHRGGPPGFLRVLDPHTLAFPDFRGNRQLITIGNLAGNDRVSLLLMDYPRRVRLKIIGHARVLDDREIRIDVVGLDWNCPAHITPRYTEAELLEIVATAPSRG